MASSSNFDINTVHVDTSALAKLGIGLQANVPEFVNLTMTQIASNPLLPILFSLNTPKAKPLHDLYDQAFGKGTPVTSLPEIMKHRVDHGDKHMEQPIQFSVLTPLLLLVVILRVWSRKIMSARLWASDWLIILGTLLTVGYEAIMIGVIVHGGAGHHMWDVTYQQIKFNLKWSYICQIYYCLNIVPIKLSLLLFYHSISPQFGYRVAVWTTGAVIVITNIIFIFLNVYICTPLNWYNAPADQNIKCINKLQLFRAQGILSFLTDIAVLILPITVVLKLQMGRREKYIVVALFILGGLGAITSVARLFTLVDFVNDSDYTWIEGSTALWTIIEAQIGIVCASVPALKAFFVRYLPTLLKSATLSHSRSRNATGGNGGATGGRTNKSTGGAGHNGTFGGGNRSNLDSKLAGNISVDVDISTTSVSKCGNVDYRDYDCNIEAGKGGNVGGGGWNSKGMQRIDSSDGGDADADSVTDLERGVIIGHNDSSKRKSGGRGFLGIGGRRSPTSKAGKVFGNDVPLYDVDVKSPAGSSTRSLNSLGSDDRSEKMSRDTTPQRREDV